MIVKIKDLIENEEDFEKVCKNHLDKYDECDNCPLGKILKNHSCSYENFEKLKEKWEDMGIEVE